MQTIRNRAKLAALFASVAAGPLFAAAPAWAQSGPTVETADASDDIVVTARRREESLQEVPIAVSSFSAELLEQTGAPDITALQQATPNLTLQVARGSNSTLIAFIRGVGQQDPLWGFEPGVGLYIDDVYVARPQGAVLDIFDIERIEVLRGPQGTLYGRNTIGGAVKYVTARLGDEATGKARVSVGSYGQLDTVLSGSVPLGDTLRVGGAVALYERDGYGKNLTTGAEHYNKDVSAYRISAEWLPTENFFVRLSADKTEDNSNARHGHREQPFLVGGVPQAAYEVLSDEYDTRAGLGDKNYVETSGYSGTAEWTLNETLTLKSVTAMREGETRTLIDFDNTSLAHLDVPAFYKDWQFSQEFQALITAPRFSGVAGVYYLNASAEGAFDTVLGLLNLAIGTYGKVNTQSLAAFGDFSIDLTDALSLSIGARYTQDDKEGRVFRANYVGQRSPFIDPRTTAALALVRTNYLNEKSFEEFTPRISLGYEVSDDLNVYAAYGKGFKSGGFDMRGDAIFTPNTTRGYDPETVDSYEAGAKGAFLDGRLTTNAAVFYSKYEGQQITRQEPTATGIASFVDNAASSSIWGVEFESFATFTQNLTGSLALGYINAEFDEYRSFTVPAGGGAAVPIDLSNSVAFQNTPEWNGNASLTYSTPISDKGTLALTGSASYRSDMQLFEVASATLDQPAFTLVDASVNFTTANDQLRIGVSGRNLTDERYRVGGYNFPGATFGNSIIGFYGPPRTVTATVELRF